MCVVKSIRCWWRWQQLTTTSLIHRTPVCYSPHLPLSADTWRPVVVLVDIGGDFFRLKILPTDRWSSALACLTHCCLPGTKLLTHQTDKHTHTYTHSHKAARWAHIHYVLVSCLLNACIHSIRARLPLPRFDCGHVAFNGLTNTPPRLGGLGRLAAVAVFESVRSARPSLSCLFACLSARCRVVAVSSVCSRGMAERRDWNNDVCPWSISLFQAVASRTSTTRGFLATI